MYKTMEQVHTEYDGEWVYMIKCDKNEYHSVAGGEVVLHSKDRDEVIRGMGAYGGEMSSTYFRYAGKIPEGTALVL